MTESEFNRRVQAQIQPLIEEGAKEDAKLRLELCRSLLLNDAITIAKFGFMTDHLRDEIQSHYREYVQALKDTA